MNKEDLSPEAKYHLRERELETTHGDWLSNYMAMLKEFAERNTSDVTEWEIKGQGIEVLEKSREKHRIAVELKAYAITQIPPDISTALAKLPESATREEFLERLMPHMGKDVQHERIMRFLANRYEGRVDVQMMAHPSNLSRAERITQMAHYELETWGYTGLCQDSQYWWQDDFKAWWKTQSDGNPLTKTNVARTEIKAAKMEKMLKLLPHNKRANETMSLDDWRKKAELILKIPSGTFDKYRKELKPRFVEKPKWRFRVDTAKPSEKM